QLSLRRLLLIVVFFSVIGGLLWWHLRPQSLPDYGPLYREYAYVTNGRSNSVSVLDLTPRPLPRFNVIKTIAVGTNPTGVTANSKKNEIYIVNTDSSNVSIVDAVRNQVTATIGVQGKPYFIDVTPDGNKAFVANSGSANVSVIDLDHRMVLG